MPTKLFLMIWISHAILMAGSAHHETGNRPPPARPPRDVMSGAVPGQSVAHGPPATLEGELLERARGSVFVVETESGHGSGFLVDAGGLIVTNDHVVRNTEYLAIAVEPRRKYPAVVVARDQLRDVAILRIHPRALKGLQPLKFIEPQAPVRIGERVLAIGAALTDDASVLTVGMVSRVAAETIVADFSRMRLFRDGVEVIPIVPGRFCSLPIQSVAHEQPADCFGLYQYAPEAFAPDATLELHVYSADARARRRVLKLPSQLVDLVWSDFEPWRTTAVRLPPAASRGDSTARPAASSSAVRKRGGSRN